MGRFLEITCPKEQAMYRRAGMLWLRAGDDPTDEYSPCGDKGREVTEEYAIEYQTAMAAGGWKYAILIEEDEGGDD